MRAKPWTAEQVTLFLDRSAVLPAGAALPPRPRDGDAPGEIVGLRWQDVDLDAGCLVVVQQIVELRGQLITGTPKTRRGARMSRWTPKPPPDRRTPGAKRRAETLGGCMEGSRPGLHSRGWPAATSGVRDSALPANRPRGRPTGDQASRPQAHQRQPRPAGRRRDEGRVRSLGSLDHSDHRRPVHARPPGGGTGGRGGYRGGHSAGVYKTGHAQDARAQDACEMPAREPARAPKEERRRKAAGQDGWAAWDSNPQPAD